MTDTHNFSDLTPPNDLIMKWVNSQDPDAKGVTAGGRALIKAAARWGAEQAAERLKGQWPEPITDRRPTEADGDDCGRVQYLTGVNRWWDCTWEHAAKTGARWLHTPRWQPPAPPTLTPQQQQAMDALDHILKHSTTNLGEATIRKAILGGEA